MSRNFASPTERRRENSKVADWISLKKISESLEILKIEDFEIGRLKGDLEVQNFEKSETLKKYVQSQWK